MPCAAHYERIVIVTNTDQSLASLISRVVDWACRPLSLRGGIKPYTHSCPRTGQPVTRLRPGQTRPLERTLPTIGREWVSARPSALRGRAQSEPRDKH